MEPPAIVRRDLNGIAVASSGNIIGDDLGVASGTTFTNACEAIFVGAQSIDPAGDAMRAMLYEIAP